MQGEQTPRAIPGELSQRPLLGLLPLLLLLLLFLLLCGFIFRPNINTFTINGEIAEKSIRAGEEVNLGWQASPFANLRLRTDVGSDIGSLSENVGEMLVAPPETTIYTLESNNLLSNLPLLGFLSDSLERRVLVDPVEPKLLRFEANPGNIVTGGEVTLSWEVADADVVSLITNGNAETIPTTQYIAQRGGIAQ